MYNNLQVTEVLLENEYQKVVKCVDEITGEIYLYNAISNTNIIRLMDIVALNELKSNIIKCFKKDDNMYILMRPHDVCKQLMIKKHVDSKKMTLKKQYNIAAQLIDLFISVYNYSDLFQLKVINFDNISVDEYDTIYVNGYFEFSSEYDLSDNYTYRSVGQILHYVFSGKEVQNGNLSDSIPPDVRKIISKCLSHEYFHPKDIKREFENSSIYGIITGKTDSIRSNYEPFTTDKKADKGIVRKELRRENTTKKNEVIEIETIVTNARNNNNIDLYTGSSVTIADKIEGNYPISEEAEAVQEQIVEEQPAPDNIAEETKDIEQNSGLGEEKPKTKDKGWKKDKKGKHKKTKEVEAQNDEEGIDSTLQDKSTQDQENDFTEQSQVQSEENNESIDRANVIVSQVDDIDEVDFFDEYSGEFELPKDADDEDSIEYNGYVGDSAGYFDDDLFIDNNKILTEEDMKKRGGQEEEEEDTEDDKVISIYLNNRGEADDDLDDNSEEYDKFFDRKYDDEYEDEYDEDDEEEEGSRLGLILKILIPLAIVAVIVGIILFFVKAINRTEESVNGFYVTEKDSENDNNMSNNSEDDNTEVNNNNNNQNTANNENNSDTGKNGKEELLKYIETNTISKTGYTGSIVAIDDSVYSSGGSSMLAENKREDSQKFLFASIDFNSEKFLRYKKSNVGIVASLKSLKDVDSVKIVVELYNNNVLSESSGFLVDVYNDIWISKHVNIDASKVDIVNLYVEITDKNNIWIDNLSIDYNK